MDATLSVVVIAIILSLICAPLISFLFGVTARDHKYARRWLIFGSGVEIYRLAPLVRAL